MNRISMRIALAMVGVASLGLMARADVVDQLTVTIPFQFEANGVTLPAGHYRVARVSDINPSEGLVLTSFDKRAIALVFPVDTGEARTENSGLTFENAGDHAVLARIQTAQHVFNFRVPKSNTTTILADGAFGGAHGSK
jgi:hypothetical protein